MKQVYYKRLICEPKLSDIPVGCWAERDSLLSEWYLGSTRPDLFGPGWSYSTIV